MRGVVRDLIRGGHYGQRSCEPRLKAEHMGAPTNAAYVKKSPCQLGAVHTWGYSDRRRSAPETSNYFRWIGRGANYRFSPRATARHVHFVFKEAIRPIRCWRISFSLIARKLRTRSAPSRVPRNETIVPSGNSPSWGAGIFFPTVGAPSKK